MRYLLLTSLLVACAPEETPDPPAPIDTAPTDTEPTDPPPVGEERPELSEDCMDSPEPGLGNWCDHSVNYAEAGLLHDAPHGLYLQTRDKTTEDLGNFEGPPSAKGNRAFAGYAGYHQTPLSTMFPFEFLGKPSSGVSELEVSLQVDLHCDGTSFTNLVTATDVFRRVKDPIDAGEYDRFSMEITDAVWFASRYDLPEPPPPVDTGDTASTDTASGDTGTTEEPEELPPVAYSYLNNRTPAPGDPGPYLAVSMERILQSYPQACITNGALGTYGYPFGAEISGLNLIIGSMTLTNKKLEWEIHEVVVGNDIHAPADPILPQE